MKKRFLSVLFCLLTLTLCVLLASCSGNDTETGTETDSGSGTNASAGEETLPDTGTKAPAETETEAETGSFLSLTAPADGETVSLLNEDMTKWLTNYKKGKLDRIFDLTERCEPVGVTLTWSCQGEPLYYHVLLSKHADMSEPELFLCVVPSLHLDRLFAGTDYWWRVDATLEAADKPGEPGETVSTPVSHFTTLYAPRTVAIDGVSNARDIGGKITADGEYRVKQGMIYRGAQMEHITPAGEDTLLNKLGVKTEIDVRDNFSASVLHGPIHYVSAAGPFYTNALEANYREALLKELRVFVDSDNYPVYFHCSLGRDRTGTLAFFLECILNMSMDDIYMDYEVSFFSDLAGFIPDLAHLDAKPSSLVTNQLGGLISSLRTTYNTSDMSEAVWACLTDFGMTEEELLAIRANMLEEIPKS